MTGRRGGTALRRAPDRGVTRSTRVVSRLSQVDIQRRRALRRAGQDPYELNTTVPEIDAIEVDNTIADAPPSETLRLIAWNLQRGRHWREASRLIQGHPDLKHPSVVFLSEMDLGMARSANEHTAREMALALKMNYAYAVEFLELTKGEPQERRQSRGENTWGYHGNAILARHPLQEVSLVRFPGIERWVGSYQSRLGGRMALLAAIHAGGRRVIVVCTHLETGYARARRRQQMGMLLQEVEGASRLAPVLLGGDLNATPDEALLKDVRRAGFLVEECNDLSAPTKYRGSRRHQHIDYILGRDVDVLEDEGTSPGVVGEESLSDHALVTVRVRPRRGGGGQ